MTKGTRGINHSYEDELAELRADLTQALAERDKAQAGFDRNTDRLARVAVELAETQARLSKTLELGEALGDRAAHAVCEPRRFSINEDEAQWRLAAALSAWQSHAASEGS